MSSLAFVSSAPRVLGENPSGSADNLPFTNRKHAAGTCRRDVFLQRHAGWLLVCMFVHYLNGFVKRRGAISCWLRLNSAKSQGIGRRFLWLADLEARLEF